MAALAGRGLIVRGSRPGMSGGIMHTVTLTRQGRAAARRVLHPMRTGDTLHVALPTE